MRALHLYESVCVRGCMFMCKNEWNQEYYLLLVCLSRQELSWRNWLLLPNGKTTAWEYSATFIHTKTVIISFKRHSHTSFTQSVMKIELSDIQIPAHMTASNYWKQLCSRAEAPYSVTPALSEIHTYTLTLGEIWIYSASQNLLHTYSFINHLMS